MVRIRGTRVALFNRTRNVFSDGASPRTVSVLPGQTILLAGSAEYALSILIHVVNGALLKRILILRFHITIAHMNGIEFISANAAIHKFLPAGTAIKRPFCPFFDQRHGKGPVL